MLVEVSDSSSRGSRLGELEPKWPLKEAGVRAAESSGVNTKASDELPAGAD